MYYGMIMGAVLMFGISFFFNERYQKHSGSDLIPTMQFSLISAIAGAGILFAVNRFALAVTPFTVLMALANSLNGLLFTFCSLKALGKINLSLYSLFSMLGGMALPFVGGILFFDEALTLAKSICVVIICAALAITVKKGSSKGGTLYYVGIFVLNGLSGILSTVYQKAPYAKGSAGDYSLLSAMVTVLISVIVLGILAIKRKDEIKKAFSLRTALYAAGHGSINRIGNWILILALAHVPASAQYPMVTGGVMIVSTVFAYFTGKKPARREILAVALSFVAIVALITIPI